MPGGGGGGGGEEVLQAHTLEYTPTWIVAGVCSLIVFISLVAERCLHKLGKMLKRKNQKALFDALLKVKEELMLLGFISLLLTVFQGLIQMTCIPPKWTNYLLPCQKIREHAELIHPETRSAAAGVLGLGGRRLLRDGGPAVEHCQRKGKVPLLSLEALHQLHIFIFVLAVAHVVFSVVTMLLGVAKIREWKQWEHEIQNIDAGNEPRKVTRLHQFEFIRERFDDVGKDSIILSWMHSFVKQFYGSVTKSDYATMRLGFIMTHCRGNPKFNFHRYMVRALEGDFKKVVGIRWYLWVFVVMFMLLNVNGWHTYFWVSFVPLLLLLAVGTKLEHIIAQLAHEVAEKHSSIEGDLVVNPSDEHFWFRQPRFILYLIRFILFQNSFELAFFFWILSTYGLTSCFMDHAPFMVPRLVIGVVIQLLCSYSTLPLYAVVTQMGTFFKKEMFNEHIQQGLLGWAQKAKERKQQSKDATGGMTESTATWPSSRLEMVRRAAAAAAAQEVEYGRGNGGEIQCDQQSAPT